MFSSSRLITASVVSVLLGATLVGAGPSVQARVRGDAALRLTPSAASPQTVATPITWKVSGGAPGSVYRCSVAPEQAGPFEIVRDFSPTPSFLMAPLAEGQYYVRVTVGSGYGATSTRTANAEFTFAPVSAALLPAVTTTNDPSVALFSTPSCSRGQVKIGFALGNSTSLQYTGSQSCDGKSLNFLVSGMLPDQSYNLTWFLTQGGSTTAQGQVTYATPAFAQSFVPGSVPAGTGIIVHMMQSLGPPLRVPVGTLANGAVVWYLTEPDLFYTWPVRMAPDPGSGIGSKIYLFGNDGQNPIGAGVEPENVFRIVDLAGNPLQETNV